MSSTTASFLALDAEPLTIAGRTFRSRLILGTGKYADAATMTAALAESGTEMVTVALRRVDLSGKTPNLLAFIDTKRYTILPNTAGCYSVEEAVKVAHLARELELGDLIKVEVIGDQKTLMPDPLETVKATEILAKEGYTVMAYCSDDIVSTRGTRVPRPAACNKSARNCRALATNWQICSSSMTDLRVAPQASWS